MQRRRPRVRIVIHGKTVWGGGALDKGVRFQPKQILSLGRTEEVRKTGKSERAPSKRRRPSPPRILPPPGPAPRVPPPGFSRKQKEKRGEAGSTEDSGGRIGASGIVHAVVYRRSDGSIERVEIMPVSMEEASKHCKRVTRGKGCVVVGRGGYYHRPCMGENAAPGCIEAIPKTVEYWGPDKRDRPCKKNINISDVLECKDQAVARLVKSKLLERVKYWAQKLKGPSTAASYRFPLELVAEHFIGLIEKERLSRDPDDPATIRRIEELGEKALKALDQVAELLSRFHPQVKSREHFEELKRQGLVTDRCPTYEIVGKPGENVLWCKKWLCIEKRGENINAYILEAWCHTDLKKVEQIKAPQ